MIDNELQEVPISSGNDADRLQESTLTDVMAILGGAGGLGSLASFAGDYFERRSNHAAELEAWHAEHEAQRRAQDVEFRALYAQTYGLDALDDLDGFGPQDDYYRGFGVE